MYFLQTLFHHGCLSALRQLCKRSSVPASICAYYMKQHFLHNSCHCVRNQHLEQLNRGNTLPTVNLIHEFRPLYINVQDFQIYNAVPVQISLSKDENKLQGEKEKLQKSFICCTLNKYSSFRATMKSIGSHVNWNSSRNAFKEWTNAWDNDWIRKVLIPWN